LCDKVGEYIELRLDVFLGAFLFELVAPILLDAVDFT
jgi:hypothetical protein